MMGRNTVAGLNLEVADITPTHRNRKRTRESYGGMPMEKDWSVRALLIYKTCDR